MEYEIKRSNRKTLVIAIDRNGFVMVKAPLKMPMKEIKRFLLEKEDWIRKKQTEMVYRQAAHQEEKALDMKDRAPNGFTYGEWAKQVIIPRVRELAMLMGITYGRVTIRQQKTRWGSCSSKGNLNFNWRLILMPEEVMDYVIIHELCHRKYMNHSQEFWDYVGTVMPDYKGWKKWLKEW